MKRIIFLQLFILSLCVLSSGCSDEPQTLPPQSNPLSSKLIAHRGVWNVPGSSANSLMSLKLAFEDEWFIGAETDIYQSADGYFVLYHDPKIDGTPLVDMTLEEIQSHTLSNGERIPTFDEALELLSRYPDKYLMLDLKAMNTPDFVEFIKDYEHKEQLIYKSFGLNICEALRKADISPVYLITWDISQVDINFCIDNGLAGVSVYTGSTLKHPESIEQYHSKGMRYLSWTPVHYSKILEFVDLGADMVVTDWIPYYSEQ